ncbi:type IV pilus modification protein PilV [Chromohalobacter japonicus]|uniref:type IV pilus modification protein PilV n=1 Tax=Chromohalobacter japonicus TaxID=223900 RepID=UPI003F92AFCA
MLLRQNGLSLIEVLVAIVVFSIGLLGTARLLVQQNQAGQESGYRAMASIMAGDLLERIKADSSGADGYVGDYEGTSLADSGGCSASNGWEAWKCDWFDDDHPLLPDPRICVSLQDQDPGQKAMVTVVWRVRAAFTSPSDLPDCVSSRDDPSNQRWVSMQTWIAP